MILRAKPLLSIVVPMWNVESYGFPWREVICEGLRPSVTEVIVAIPTNSNDETLKLISEWSKREDRLHWIAAPAVLTKGDIAVATNEAISAALGDVVYSAQADELLEMDDRFIDSVHEAAPALNDEPIVVGFPRWDFTWSASHVEPVWDHEPPVNRLFGRRHYPAICARDDAMHVDGPGAKVLWTNHPIFHYHGLSEDAVWRIKEVAFQELFGMRDERLLSPDRSAFKDRHDRAYPVPRRHPHVMGPWLSQSDLVRRDYQMELKSGNQDKDE